MYLALGSRLSNLAIVEGNVLWVNQGIYKIERLQAADESQHRTTVYNRFMDRRAEIPEDLVRGMTMKELEVHQNFSLDSAYVMLLTGDTLVLESLFPRIHQMRGLRRRLSHELGVTGDEEHGVSPPPAKKQKTSGVGHAPTAAVGAPTPGVPSPPSGVVGSKAGGVAATPSHPALAASEDEAGSEETMGREKPDED